MESTKNMFLRSVSRKRKKNDMKKRWFLDNGSILLKELIADCNGKSISIRSFSSDQILKATNNFDSSCFVSEDTYYDWYEGKIDDKSYMIKRFPEDKVKGYRVGVYKSIVLSARMSNHNNFLKLLGCCLEFSFPVLVFEYAEHGVLDRQGHIIVNGEESILPWTAKLSETKCFLRNGSMFLEELIADCNGISNPIRMFSSDQISKATDHFDPKSCSIATSSWFTWYKGVIERRSYVIKRFTCGGEELAYNDIALSSRASNYSGFHKLIGCCLEFPLPVLLFEDTEFRFLNSQGSVGHEDAPLLPWNVRLKIAKEIAIALTYLHTGFPRIIIHRDITPSHVFLDKNWTSKMTDFSTAVTLPEGKSWSEEDTVMGTIGYTDPNYSSTGILTASSDVYSFGIFMLVLLMGRPAFLKDSPVRYINNYVKDLRERGEPVEFGGDSDDMRPDQMKMFLDLALRCCEDKNEDKPTMIMVAKEIKLIEKVSLVCYNSNMLQNGSDE